MLKISYLLNNEIVLLLAGDLHEVASLLLASLDGGRVAEGPGVAHAVAALTEVGPAVGARAVAAGNVGDVVAPV